METQKTKNTGQNECVFFHLEIHLTVPLILRTVVIFQRLFLENSIPGVRIVVNVNSYEPILIIANRAVSMTLLAP